MTSPKRISTIMWLTSVALSVAMFASPLRNIAQSVSMRSATRAGAGKHKANHPALSRYAVDLTQLAKQNLPAARSHHKTELSRVVKILSENADRNPVLIGDAGEGNAADVADIAFGFARKIVTLA